MKSWSLRCTEAGGYWAADGSGAVVCAESAAAQTGPAISLTVDASQVAQKIVRTREVLAVKEGPLTLYYPKWIPGEHEPDGPIANVSGAEVHGEWADDSLEARLAGCVHVSCGCAGGSKPAGNCV